KAMRVSEIERNCQSCLLGVCFQKRLFIEAAQFPWLLRRALLRIAVAPRHHNACDTRTHLPLGGFELFFDGREEFLFRGLRRGKRGDERKERQQAGTNDPHNRLRAEGCFRCNRFGGGKPVSGLLCSVNRDREGAGGFHVEKPPAPSRSRFTWKSSSFYF